jgi:AmmeMemoRadiSam system protein A
MYTEAQRAQMLELAISTIRQALTTGRREVASDYPEYLREPGASFVTLRRHGQLLGCIGALQAFQPLGRDICDHALAAAFEDPRFAPLDSLDEVHVEISILGPLVEFPADSYADVVQRLPKIGAVVEAHGRRGTFLPAVWAQLSDRRDFVAGLWRKAGLRPGFWPVDLWTYEVEEFGRDV